MDEICLPSTLSPSVKIHDCTNVPVEDSRNFAWSMGDSIRFTGFVNVMDLRDGGGASAGVHGVELDSVDAFDGAARRPRGISFGIDADPFCATSMDLESCVTEADNGVLVNGVLVNDCCLDMIIDGRFESGMMYLEKWR